MGEVLAEQIQVWENDPASSGLVSVDKPAIDQPPFQFSFPPPRPNPDSDTSTLNFRYWNAAAALTRSVQFWGPAVAPETDWFGGPILDVRLNVGVRWNAGYDRRALNFFRGQLAPGTFIYAAESPDLLSHELGHAMLDVAQRQLWHSANEEIAAFHESFGDVSAILCALQLESMRSSILASTSGNIYAASRLSRIAEQFGTALHSLFPADADCDCLRNAHNSFCYAPPASLNPSGPSSTLTAKPHSFSRVYTGAILEILAGMLAVHPVATPDQLRDITIELRDIMIEAVTQAPLVPQYYASVAAKMMLAAASKNPAYQAVFRSVFVRRLILSLESATAILTSATPKNDTGFAAQVIEHSYTPKIGPIPSAHYGLDQPLYVELPADPAETIARSAARNGRSIEPLSVEDAARTFVDRLFINGLVDYGESEGKGRRDREPGDTFSPVQSTHRIERIDDRLMLRRTEIH